MNILIVNLHSSRNAGDAALALVSAKYLRNSFSDASITLAMNDPDSHPVGTEKVVGSFMTWFMRQQNGIFVGWRWFSIPWFLFISFMSAVSYRLFEYPIIFFTSSRQQKLLKAYFEADLVVSCPGNMLQSLGRLGFPLFVTAYTLFYAKLAGKPVYMLPQSIGPLMRFWERWIVKKLLDFMSIISVREPVTYEKLVEMGVDLSKCYLIPDIAFGFSGALHQNAKQILSELGVSCKFDRPLLGITVLNWQAQNRNFSRQEEYENAVSAAIDEFISRYNGFAIIFPQVWGPTQDQDDRVPARRIAKRLQHCQNRLLCVENPMSPDLLKSVYGLMDLFIGTRMHSNIFALSEGVPVIAIGYLHKTRGIMKMLQLENWALDINHLDDKKLISMLNLIWPQRKTLHKYLQQIMPSIIQETKVATELIASDYFALQKDSQ